MNEWNSGRMRRALVRYLGWSDHMLIPEFDLDGGRCDMIQVSRAGYATEYEIKISLADWRADDKKRKWHRHRPHISRFFFVVPASIVPDPLPPWVPGVCGIIVVGSSGLGHDYTHELRPSCRVRSRKLDDLTMRRAYEAFYFRFWRHDDAMARARAGLREMNRKCPKCSGRMRCRVCERQDYEAVNV